MILIDGAWESIDTIEDIIRVVGEHYNPELAEALSRMYFPRKEAEDALDIAYGNIDELLFCQENLEKDINDAEQEIEDLKTDKRILMCRIDKLTQENEKLCKEIDA